MATGAAIELKEITKVYGQQSVLSGINLQVIPGEILAILGPSGCGKSTLLRMIAGLEQITDGELLIDGQLSNDRRPGDRGIAMVFQDYALYPNMTVAQNVAYGLKVAHIPAAAREAAVMQALKIVNLTDHQDALPHTLSGGQKQRVALARGMAKKSALFLLDEPLSNIDVQLRATAREEILRVHEIAKQTIIYVTHDQSEALALGDRVLVLNEGQIQMLGTPYEVYHQPANVFVARFVGARPMTIIQCDYRQQTLRVEDQVIEHVPEDWVTQLTGYENQTVLLGIRPENITVVSAEPASRIGQVTRVMELGREVGIGFTFAGQSFQAITDRRDLKVGDDITFHIDATAQCFFDPQTEERIGGI